MTNNILVMENISKRVEYCCTEILEKKSALLKIYTAKIQTMVDDPKCDPTAKRNEKRKAQRVYESDLFEFILLACSKYKVRMDFIFKIMHPSGINWMNSIKKSRIQRPNQA